MVNRIQRSGVGRETISYFPEILQRHGERLKKAVKDTKFYYKVERLTERDKEGKKYETRYRCFKGDTLDIARKLQVHSGLKPCILNMASDKNPGGGWRSGTSAQEEQLFYRSTYDLSLTDKRGIDEERGWKYPIPNIGAIYSPDVFVFRKSEKDNFEVLDWEECLFMDFVAVAAVRHPLLTADEKYVPRDEKLMKEKIRNILRVAASTGHKDVLLGAFGCGAFANPPEEVAKLFMEVFREEEFIGVFKHVDFAILDGPRDRNYQVFSQMVDWMNGNAGK
jgi:uncharacterized protein (TIGR02452 family)